MAEDERDPKLSRHYRELGEDVPRPEIDAAILAAARRAAEMRPAPLVAPTGRRRWYFPVAAAAIIVLAVAVTVHVERQKPDFEDSVAGTAPAQAPQAPKEVDPMKREAPAPEAKPERRVVPEPAPAPPPAATPAPRDNRLEEARNAAGAETSADRSARSQAAPAPGARGDAQSRAKTYAAADPPERWLERIAELRRQGRDKEADESLAEFRKRFPDYRIPEAMLEKIEKK